MKKLLVLAVLSSSMLFAGKVEVAKNVAAAAKVSVSKVIAPAAGQKTSLCVQAVTALKNVVKQGKEHYLIAGSALATAGIVTLYYTNAQFRATVRAWLGLDAEVKK